MAFPLQYFLDAVYSELEGNLHSAGYFDALKYDPLSSLGFLFRIRILKGLTEKQL